MGWSPFLIFLGLVGFSQSPDVRTDYRTTLGTDYDYAVKVIETNSWWSDSLSKDGLDPAFSLAIIFPELIRYSSIADYIEVKALEVLYVQYGRDYADFSIGLFQMKPSFAEKIENDMLKFELVKTFPELSRLKPDSSKTTVCRSDRIVRLKDEYYQVLYLEAFIRIMDTIYPDSVFHSEDEKLIFYATAYNTGYFKDESEIRNEISRKRFYLGMKSTAEKYNYSEIASWYYLVTTGD